MIDRLIEILTITSFLELFLIFFAKIIEVSIGTLRIILINKGYRRIGVILALIEIILWVFIASRVINGIQESPMKGIMYSLGFAVGVYVGSKLEEKIAFGKVLIQTITSVASGKEIADYLRKEGYGVTIIDGRGKDETRSVLMLYSNRRGSNEVIEKIQKINPKAMVIINDVSTLSGGFISPMKSLLK